MEEVNLPDHRINNKTAYISRISFKLKSDIRIRLDLYQTKEHSKFWVRFVSPCSVSTAELSLKEVKDLHSFLSGVLKANPK